MANSSNTAALQGLRSRMISILQCDAAQNIDFYLDNIHVDGSGLSFVALALLSEPRGQQGLNITLGGLNPSLLAGYDQPTNTFRFPSANYGSTPFDRMTIVHESVHAWRDSLGKTLPTRSGRKITRAVSDEAAAYLAGAWFFLGDQAGTISSDLTPPWADDGSVYDHALALAIQIRLQSNPKGCNVNDFNPTNLQALKDVIRKVPYYRSIPQFNYNGVNL